MLRFFPPALIALMLILFGYYSFHYHFMLDDFEFRNGLRVKNAFTSSFDFYNIYNGRLASHLFLHCIIGLFRNSETLLFVYRFAMLSGFIISLAWLLRTYMSAFRNKIITNRKAFYFSAFITSFLFFFFFAGIMEVWFWVSSTGVYLISLIIAMNAFALLLSEKQNAGKAALSAFLFFLAGGFSESFAIMFLVLLICLFLKFRKEPRFIKHRPIALFCMGGIIGGVMINLLSPGAQNRLEILHHFSFGYAIKNTLHSLAFPFLRYKYLLIEILLTGTLLLYAHFYFPIKRAGWNCFLKRAVPVLVFISASFFLPCYILSDIVPDRAASLGYLAGVLFLFDYFIFRSETFQSEIN